MNQNGKPAVEHVAQARLAVPVMQPRFRAIVQSAVSFALRVEITLQCGRAGAKKIR